ncbi:MAG: 4a-hydroxytetrahydrobiopterin dehydratase [Gammaproteobacteria bacterium]
MSLADNRCVPCRGGVPPLPDDDAQKLLQQLDAEWALNADGHLEREYGFKNFNDAMGLANLVAAIADEEDHHPDLTIAWGKCGVEIWTHKISGLTESDFFFAAKVDRAAASLANVADG